MSVGKSRGRVAYALTRVLVTRTHGGRKTVNWSKLLGSVPSDALSNVYYPPDQRGAGLTFSRAGVNLGTAALFNVLVEFWPDIQRKLTRSKGASVSPADDFR